MSAKCFKPLYGFCTHLEAAFHKDELVINLPDKYTAKLCQELNNQWYTYLVISDGLCHEIVCVELVEGLLMATRGVDCTDKQYWTCGAAVKYDSVPSAIYDMTQMKVELPEPDCEPELFKVRSAMATAQCTLRTAWRSMRLPIKSRFKMDATTTPCLPTREVS